MQFPKSRQILIDALRTVGILAGTFGLNLAIKELLNTQNMIPAVFVLGVFLIARRTQGYFWGVSASLVSVLLMNFAFTYPIWAFDLTRPTYLAAAAVMLAVSIMTCALTTRIKRQEKNRADAEMERMRGNLLRAVSHDLRTPLTAIYGICSTLMENYDEIPKDKQMNMLSDVCGDAQWLVRMVENLLSVTRIDGGQVELNKRETALEELIDVLLIKFRKHYPDQQVQVQLPEEFVSIPMDAMLMEQVLMNLMENAVIHARGMKNLWLTVTVKGGRAVFQVMDDGCGIPADRMDRLFQGFSSGLDPADSGRANMGIGLTVCSAIVKAHGGELQARARRGGGTIFSFALDMEEPINGQQ